MATVCYKTLFVETKQIKTSDM